MPTTSYAIALGSNRPGRHGTPADEIRAALAAIGTVVAASPIVASAPVGPSIRRYANAAAIVESERTPPDMLAHLKGTERAFGRRPGRRWGARVIDLDIILWSGGIWTGPDLTIPHRAFRNRDFVLAPLAAIAPDWRDPITGRTVCQLRALSIRRRPLS